MPPRGDYNSGTDYLLEYGDMSYSFNEDDFLERCEQAARMLDLVHRELTAEERADLAATVVNGEPPTLPESELGFHLHVHWRYTLDPEDDLLGGPPADGEERPRFVSWMRRLIFRGAWVDQRIVEGELEPRVSQGAAFEYVEARPGGRPLEFTPPASFAAAIYFGED